MVAKVAAEWRFEFQFVLAGDLFSHFGDLLFVAHDQSEMPHPIRLNLVYFEDGEKLMLPQLEERIAFAAVELLKIEDVFVERDSLANVVDLDGNVVTPVNVNAHGLFESLPVATSHLTRSTRKMASTR